MWTDRSQDKSDDVQEERQGLVAGRATGSFVFVFKDRRELSAGEDRGDEVTKPVEKELTEDCWCGMD